MLRCIDSGIHDAVLVIFTAKKSQGRHGFTVGASLSALNLSHASDLASLYGEFCVYCSCVSDSLHGGVDFTFCVHPSASFGFVYILIHMKLGGRSVSRFLA